MHHFPSRAALLLAAADHLVETRFGLDGPVPAPHPDVVTEPCSQLDRAVEAMWATFHQPYFWAAIELWTAGRTDRTLAAALLPAERRLGAAIRRAVDGALPEFVDHPAYRTTRDVLISSMRGVALTYAFDPRDPRADPHLEQWKETARALVLPGVRRPGR